jgi:hypothetical protein
MRLTAMSMAVQPFFLQLPSGYSLSATSPATTGTAVSSANATATASSTTGSAASSASSTTQAAPAANPVDVVSISNASDAGGFDVNAGDVYQVSDLFQGQTGVPGTSVAGYRLALGAGGGTLTLNGNDVTSQTSFTAAQFAQLTYTAGTSGSQSLVVAAQTGILQSNGTLTQIADSSAVQVTANVVTGTRSINALSALVTPPDAPDANVVGVVKEAGILTGFGGSPRPTVQTVGNFTADANDVLRMSDLFSGQTGTPGTSITGYRLALGEGDGTLTLNGNDVTSQTSFTAAQFAQLTYAAGSSGSQSLVIAAQTGDLQPNGALTHVVDSPAVQITASVTDATGTRSINMMSALVTPPDTADANVVSVVKEAGILTGVGGSARPTVQTVGNFTADANDVLRMSDLFSGQTGTPGTSITGYRLALGAGDGTLTLNGNDVTSQTSFTAAQFAQLTYTAGSSGSQSLVIAAQTGDLQPNGTLTQVVDSAAVQITASVADATGTRSINAMGALVTPADAADANVVGVVKEAGILTGVGGSPRPTLQTVGNFTADANDVLRLSDLFQGQTGVPGTAVAGYRLALGAGDGTLTLNGNDVTSQTSFTAAQFAQLTYTAGSSGSQSLVAVAQTGDLQSNGTVTQLVDSPAVQITASVTDATGTRSLNAMSALVTPPDTADANVVGVVQEAAILTGVGGLARPTMQTVGNFTADANDVLRMSDLFSSQTGPPGTSITGYRLALGEGDGTLTLNGNDVTSQTSFTAAQFAQLTYTAGSSGSQSLVIAAQTGDLQANGTLTQVVDSPAVQIIASVADATGTRSINAMSALVTQPDASDANVVNLVKEAGILTGFGASPRPTLETVFTSTPNLSPAALAIAVGAYNQAGAAIAGSAINLTSFDPTAVGGSVSPGILAATGGSLATALQLLDRTAEGAFQTADQFTTQAQAINAYSSAQSG